MSLLFGFILPLAITLAPFLFLLIKGYKKIRTGDGLSIYMLTSIALGSGLITPILAMAVSILFLSAWNDSEAYGGCYTFVTGFIGIGIIIEIIFIPVTVIFLMISRKMMEQFKNRTMGVKE